MSRIPFHLLKISNMFLEVRRDSSGLHQVQVNMVSSDGSKCLTFEGMRDSFSFYVLELQLLVAAEIKIEGHAIHYNVLSKRKTHHAFPAKDDICTNLRRLLASIRISQLCFICIFLPDSHLS